MFFCTLLTKQLCNSKELKSSVIPKKISELHFVQKFEFRQLWSGDAVPCGIQIV